MIADATQGIRIARETVVRSILVRMIQPVRIVMTPWAISRRATVGVARRRRLPTSDVIVAAQDAIPGAPARAALSRGVKLMCVTFAFPIMTNGSTAIGVVIRVYSMQMTDAIAAAA